MFSFVSVFIFVFGLHVQFLSPGRKSFQEAVLDIFYFFSTLSVQNLSSEQTSISQFCVFICFLCVFLGRQVLLFFVCFFGSIGSFVFHVF